LNCNQWDYFTIRGGKVKFQRKSEKKRDADSLWELKVDRQEEQLLKVDRRKRLGKITEKCTVHQGD
jgi:hypothetical protein